MSTAQVCPLRQSLSSLQRPFSVVISTASHHAPVSCIVKASTPLLSKPYRYTRKVAMTPHILPLVGRYEVEGANQVIKAVRLIDGDVLRAVPVHVIDIELSAPVEPAGLA